MNSIWHPVHGHGPPMELIVMDYADSDTGETRLVTACGKDLKARKHDFVKDVEFGILLL